MDHETFGYLSSDFIIGYNNASAGSDEALALHRRQEEVKSKKKFKKKREKFWKFPQIPHYLSYLYYIISYHYLYLYHFQVLRKFRSKTLNLLITTSVLEEGIDVRQCNVVIRFDKPNNYRSYIRVFFTFFFCV